jgi:hypothetical protein
MLDTNRKTVGEKDAAIGRFWVPFRVACHRNDRFPLRLLSRSM